MADLVVQTTIGNWRRAPECDQRIAKGDDWAGDTWRHNGQVRYCSVGHVPDPTLWDEPEELRPHG